MIPGTSSILRLEVIRWADLSETITSTTALITTASVEALPALEPLIKEVLGQSVWAGVLFYILMYTLKSKDIGEKRSSDVILAQIESSRKIEASLENLAGSVDQLSRELLSLKLSIQGDSNKVTCASKIEPKIDAISTTVSGISTNIQVIESHVLERRR